MSNEPTLVGNFTTIFDEISPLTCSSEGGSPPAQIKWFLDDGESEVEITDDRNSTEDISVLFYTPKKEHNGAEIVCKVSQEGLDNDREAREQVKVLCKFLNSKWTCYLILIRILWHLSSTLQQVLR